MMRTSYERLAVNADSARGEIDSVLIELRTWLASTDAAAAVHSLSPEELGSPFGLVVLEAWLRQDAAAASAWIASQPGHSDAQAWLVAHTLTREPRALAVLCETLGTDVWSQTVLDYAGREVLPTNPTAAVAFAEGLNVGERQARLFDAIATDWGMRDGPAARAWIGGIADPELRARLAAIGASSYASIDPLAAMEWLLAQTSPSRLPEPAVKTIAGIWQNLLRRAADDSSGPIRRVEASSSAAAPD